MNKSDEKIVKRNYNTPKIISVELDNDISLALESTPPVGPGEVTSQFNAKIENHFFDTELV